MKPKLDHRSRPAALALLGLLLTFHCPPRSAEDPLSVSSPTPQKPPCPGPS